MRKDIIDVLRGRNCSKSILDDLEEVNLTRINRFTKPYLLVTIGKCVWFSASAVQNEASDWFWVFSIVFQAVCLIVQIILEKYKRPWTKVIGPLIFLEICLQTVMQAS